jgi:hypothetical protein
MEESDAEKRIQKKRTARETAAGNDNLNKRAGPPTQKRMKEISIMPIEVKALGVAPWSMQ